MSFKHFLMISSTEVYTLVVVLQTTLAKFGGCSHIIRKLYQNLMIVHQEAWSKLGCSCTSKSFLILVVVAVHQLGFP